MARPIAIKSGNVTLTGRADGDGELVLFLHGFPETSETWHRQIAYFAKDRLAVAMDLRGFGQSDKPAGVENYAFERHMEDFQAVLSYFGKKSATVVGHDWGGILASLFANKHPELVKKLVMINAPYLNLFARAYEQSAKQRAASSYILFFRSPEFPGSDLDKTCRMIFADFPGLVKKGLMPQTQLDDYLIAAKEPGRLIAMTNLYRSDLMGENGVTVWDGKITVPTEVIWGQDDRYLTEMCIDGIEEFVPNVKVTKLADVTHWVMQETGEDLNQLLEKII